MVVVGVVVVVVAFFPVSELQLVSNIAEIAMHTVTSISRFLFRFLPPYLATLGIIKFALPVVLVATVSIL